MLLCLRLCCPASFLATLLLSLCQNIEGSQMHKGPTTTLYYSDEVVAELALSHPREKEILSSLHRLRQVNIERLAVSLRNEDGSDEKKFSTYVLQARESKNGGDTSCWDDAQFNFRRCCHTLNPYVSKNHCWGGGFDYSRCCGEGDLYFPSNCGDLVRFFDIAHMISPGHANDPIANAVLQCTDWLREEGEGGNKRRLRRQNVMAGRDSYGSPIPSESDSSAVNGSTTVRSTAKVSEDLTTSSSPKAHPLPPSHRINGEDFPSGDEPFSLAGVHYPTATVHHTGNRKYSFPALDVYVGNNLLNSGAWMASEVSMLVALLRRGDVVVDAGANIGAFTLPLARAVGRTGMIYSFEPFRVIYQHLTANVALNGLLNVVTFPIGLGNESAYIRRPMPNLNKISNPSKSHVTEDVANNMLVETEPDFFETIEVKTLDSFLETHLSTDPMSNVDVLMLSHLSSEERKQYYIPKKKVALIKIDVESMEMPMLRGMNLVLIYHRPFVFVEDSNHMDLIEYRAKVQSKKDGETTPDLDNQIAEFKKRFPPLDRAQRPSLFQSTLRELFPNYDPNDSAQEEPFMYPEISMSTEVTRLLYYYGYLCVDLYRHLGGQQTSHLCGPDENIGSLLDFLMRYYAGMRLL